MTWTRTGPQDLRHTATAASGSCRGHLRRRALAGTHVLRRGTDKWWHTAGIPRAREPDLESATVLLREVGAALASFSAIGLRHRALHPGNILIRSTSPLDLVITGFESARLSDFDLDVVSPLQVNRYSAPEAIVGAVSASSDWWSLGVILLEHLSRGDCFHRSMTRHSYSAQSPGDHHTSRTQSAPRQCAPRIARSRPKRPVAMATAESVARRGDC